MCDEAIRKLRLLLSAYAILLANLISGCSDVQGGKLLAPEQFGLNRIAPGIYVEAGANAATREQILEVHERAMLAIRAVYGNVTSSPIVNACVSERCYQSFGGQDSIAKIYGNRILLSPRALDWHFLAHEWSHDEILKRLSFTAWRRLPQWFDDGLAVAISEAPEHSETHWLWLVQSNIRRPTREELHTLKSQRQWSAAVDRYAETANNAQRKMQGLPEIRPVYAAAGHEVRPWLAAAGTPGLIQLIQQLNNGEAFDQAYQVIDATVVHTAW